MYYLILTPCEECRTDINHHVCASHPGMTHHYERQAFRHGTSGYRLDATPEEIAKDYAHVWGWDGNVESPTLKPSFLGQEKNKEGQTIRPYRLHLFFTKGQIDLLGDSTVTLHPAPVACRDREAT